VRGVLLDGVDLPRAGLLQDLLEAECERPNAPLLRFMGEDDWTVGDLVGRARACAGVLRERGVGAGDRVAIMSRFDTRAVAWAIGIYMLGAVEIEINADLRGPLLRHVIKDSDLTLIIAQSAGREVIEALGDLHVPIIDSATAFPSGDAPDSIIATRGPSDLITIMHTSGTTGPSKGVMLSNGYFSNYGAVIRKVFDLRHEDVWYFPLPFFHIDSHTVFAACVQAGAVLAFPERFTASRFWAHIAAAGATHFVAVGAMQDALINYDPPPPEVARNIRCAFAVPVSPEAYEFFEDRLGIPMLQAFGQTEADCPVYSTIDRRRRGAAGWACAGHDVAVVDADGVELPPGESGEIIYRPNYPDMITLGYWGRPEATLEAMRDLWWHTGDAGHFDEDGFLYFDGRIKDALRHRGENVSAWELEGIVREAPGVSDVAAVAMRDDLGTEDEIKLFVVLEPGAAFEPGALFAFCEQNLARFAVPRYLEPIDEAAVVRSYGTGVIQKHRLPTENGPRAADRRDPGSDDAKALR
jgi:carnitine-CoA ligase